MPGIIWPLLALAVLLFFRHDLRRIARALNRRIDLGAGIRIASLHLQAVTANEKRFLISKRIEQRNDDGVFQAERIALAERCRDFFLVHRLQPSEQNGMLYDAVIFIEPWKDSTLLTGIRTVEYYFGENWGRQVFVSIDRANGFPVTTSAWGSFVCLARLTFSDGHQCTLSRLIDFER